MIKYNNKYDLLRHTKIQMKNYSNIYIIFIKL